MVTVTPTVTLCPSNLQQCTTVTSMTRPLSLTLSATKPPGLVSSVTSAPAWWYGDGWGSWGSDWNHNWGTSVDASAESSKTAAAIASVCSPHTTSSLVALVPSSTTCGSPGTPTANLIGVDCGDNGAAPTAFGYVAACDTYFVYDNNADGTPDAQPNLARLAAGDRQEKL